MKITPLLLTGAFAMSAAQCLLGGTFTANFNDGQVPANTAVFGNTVVESTGGVSDSGTLKLTKAVNSQTGAFIINDFDANATVYGFEAKMMVRVGGGTPTPADGWSFNFAPDLPDAAFTEEGAGTGLTVTFDTYDNGGGEAPAVDVKVGGQVVVSTKVPISELLTGNGFVPVTIRLKPNGSLDVDYNGKVYYTNLFLMNYVGLSGARFGFGAKTGGLNENAFIDDLTITTQLQPQVGIASQPQDVTVLQGRDATFSAVLLNGDIATLQWLRNGSPIAGETSSSYTLTNAATTDSGAKFSLKTTAPAGTVTTREATLKVVTIDLPTTPVRSMDFNDASIPASTAVYGNAFVDASGGVNGSGVLKITTAENDQAGSFIIEDPNAGAPVYGFAASFKVLLGGGTALPADGFSFNFAPDIPDSATGELENGQGTGVTVTFDTYDNGGGEAPAAELRIGGTVVATKHVPAGFFVTNDQFQDVVIRLTPDGLFDLAWNGVVLFDRVPAPGFSSITGGRFSIAGRTGGANENVFIDDLKIYTYNTATAIRITTQPASQLVLPGRPATFGVEVNLPAQATYEWSRNGSPITGATQSTYQIASVGTNDNGAKFTVKVTGTANNVTSDEATLTVLNLQAPQNPQVNFDFNSGVPTNAHVYGTTIVDANGGVNDSGVLKVTIAENSQNGAFLIDPLENGAELNGFTAAFKLRMGGGTSTPADGFSFNWATDLPAASIGDAEKGTGSGLTVGFDIYVNADQGETSPSIRVKYNGNLITQLLLPLSAMRTGDVYTNVIIRLSPQGTLDLAYGDQVLFNGLAIPGFTSMAGGKFGIYGRTGGLNENIWIDDLQIGASKVTGPTRITTNPSDALILPNQTATFSVLINDPAGVTFQWYRNGTAITGATQQSYTTPALTTADSGTQYTVKATGNGSVTSTPATVTVMTPIGAPANPQIAMDFNDGSIPAGATVFGSALVDTTGGAGNSGVLKLTIAENDQHGGILIESPAGVDPVTDIVVTWKMRMGGGTTTPADGVGFAFAPDLPDNTIAGREGAGSGLSVGFDTYDNGGGEAPAIDVFYKTEHIATRKVPITLLETGDTFVDVALRVKPDGKLDLTYGTNAIFSNLQLPNYVPFSAGRFGFGGDTGGLNDNQWIDDIKIAVNSLPAAGPTMQVGRSSTGGVQISWPGGGTLQSVNALGGTWTDLTSATSPYTVPPTNSMQFFRVKK